MTLEPSWPKASNHALTCRWENGMYSLKLIFSQDFPDVHPRPRFETKMFHPQVPPSTPPASERGGNTLKGVQDCHVVAKARIWPFLSYVWHVRSKAVQPLPSPSGPAFSSPPHSSLRKSVRRNLPRNVSFERAQIRTPVPRLSHEMGGIAVTQRLHHILGLTVIARGGWPHLEPQSVNPHPGSWTVHLKPWCPCAAHHSGGIPGEN